MAGKLITIEIIVIAVIVRIVDWKKALLYFFLRILIKFLNHNFLKILMFFDLKGCGNLFRGF